MSTLPPWMHPDDIADAEKFSIVDEVPDSLEQRDPYSFKDEDEFNAYVADRNAKFHNEQLNRRLIVRTLRKYAVILILENLIRVLVVVAFIIWAVNVLLAASRVLSNATDGNVGDFFLGWGGCVLTLIIGVGLGVGVGWLVLKGNKKIWSSPKIRLKEWLGISDD